jgi:hypothetical protein
MASLILPILLRTPMRKLLRLVSMIGDFLNKKQRESSRQMVHGLRKRRSRPAERQSGRKSCQNHNSGYRS